MPDVERHRWVELDVLLAKDGMKIPLLAELSDLSPSYLYDLRLGRRRPTPRVIAEIARVLNVPKSMLEPRTATEVAA